ncbi:MAG: KamA family radical SAM protein [Leptospiraceae bacterium]|nr:KamA family radical SAM protein [Leptospiraceae bacterium]MCP5510894.1 KamA family radical SAM protein [Leptospiraceae bacterium]
MNLKDRFSPSDWENWKWQIQSRIRNAKELQDCISLTPSELETFQNTNRFFEFGTTLYYLSLINPDDPNCPIRKQIIPSPEELEKRPYETIDPLGEEAHMPVRGVTHRYPDRALWYLSHMCAVFCRFCTRKRKVGKSGSTPGSEDWEEAIHYFRTHPEIKEVILSGGDPLSLSDGKIEYLLGALRSISSINHIRIHSRYPVTLPYRITEDLGDVLGKFSPIYFVTHFNHPMELTQVAKERLNLLRERGKVILLNQSVLLKGINDSPEVLSELNYALTSSGVKPYYLHQCDEVFGSSGFRVPIQKGIEIMKSLRGYMSGITVPSYVIDLNGGGGKIPLPTDYLEKTDAEHYYFQNYQGRSFSVPKE